MYTYLPVPEFPCNSLLHLNRTAATYLVIFSFLNSSVEQQIHIIDNGCCVYLFIFFCCFSVIPGISWCRRVYSDSWSKYVYISAAIRTNIIIFIFKTYHPCTLWWKQPLQAMISSPIRDGNLYKRELYDAEGWRRAGWSIQTACCQTLPASPIKLYNE